MCWKLCDYAAEVRKGIEAYAAQCLLFGVESSVANVRLQILHELTLTAVITFVIVCHGKPLCQFARIASILQSARSTTNTTLPTL